MRWIFFLLLIVNLVVFIWGMSRETPPEVQAMRLPPGVQRLQFAHEPQGGEAVPEAGNPEEMASVVRPVQPVAAAGDGEEVPTTAEGKAEEAPEDPGVDTGAAIASAHLQRAVEGLKEVLSRSHDDPTLTLPPPAAGHEDEKEESGSEPLAAGGTKSAPAQAAEGRNAPVFRAPVETPQTPSPTQEEETGSGGAAAAAAEKGPESVGTAGGLAETLAATGDGDRPPADSPGKGAPAAAEDEAPAGAPAAQETMARSAAPARCSTLGPLPDRQVMERLQALAAGEGIRTRPRTELVAEVGSGYWVVIPPLPSRESAVRMVAELKIAGIQDLWRLTKGRMANGISLGLFSSKRQAEVFAARMRSKGFAVEVRPRNIARTVYWLDLWADPQAPALRRLQGRISPRYPEAALRPGPACDGS